MSGDSFKPEEGGEVEVINPDEGNNEIDAQPEEGDAMDAAESEAMKAFESSMDNETTEEEVEPEPDTEVQQAEQDQAEPEAQDEVEPESPRPAWDGNPATLPEELQPTYQSMLKGFHTKTRELAAERRKTEELQAKLLLKVSGGDPAEAKAEEPPPLPLEPKDQAEWNAAVTEQNKWFAERARLENLKALKESGEFAPAEKVQKLEAEKQVTELQDELMALPGFTDDHAGQMAEIYRTNEFWAKSYDLDPRQSAHQLAELVMSKTKATDDKSAAAAAATAKIQKKATAASRATPRIATPKGATPEDVFAKTGFMSEDERMAHAERVALENLGG